METRKPKDIIPLSLIDDDLEGLKIGKIQNLRTIRDKLVAHTDFKWYRRIGKSPENFPQFGWDILGAAHKATVTTAHRLLEATLQNGLYQVLSHPQFNVVCEMTGLDPEHPIAKQVEEKVIAHIQDRNSWLREATSDASL